MDIDLKTRTTRRHTLKLQDCEIVELVSQELKAQGIKHTLGEAKDIRVFVHIPGGGDYSSIDLDIDESCPLTITWTTEE